jgi:hypothetical protein
MRHAASDGDTTIKLMYLGMRYEKVDDNGNIIK